MHTVTAQPVPRPAAFSSTQTELSAQRTIAAPATTPARAKPTPARPPAPTPKPALSAPAALLVLAPELAPLEAAEVAELRREDRPLATEDAADERELSAEEAPEESEETSEEREDAAEDAAEDALEAPLVALAPTDEAALDAGGVAVSGVREDRECGEAKVPPCRDLVSRGGEARSMMEKNRRTTSARNVCLTTRGQRDEGKPCRVARPCVRSVQGRNRNDKDTNGKTMARKGQATHRHHTPRTGEPRQPRPRRRCSCSRGSCARRIGTGCSSTGRTRPCCTREVSTGAKYGDWDVQVGAAVRAGGLLETGEDARGEAGRGGRGGAAVRAALRVDGSSSSSDGEDEGGELHGGGAGGSGREERERGGELLWGDLGPKRWACEEGAIEQLSF